MKLLVTGGAGFIGSHVADRCLARGDRVVVLDDFNDFYDPRRKRANVRSHLGNASYRLVEKAQRILGFRAGVPLEEGLRRPWPGTGCRAHEHLHGRNGLRRAS